MKIFHVYCVSVVFIFCLTSTIAADKVAYKIQDLGGLGGADSRAIYITNEGVVYGVSSVKNYSEHHAFRWDENQGMVDLGPLDASSQQYVDIKSFNDSGQACGSHTWINAGQIERYAIYWDSQSGLQEIFPPSVFSIAHSINNQGIVAGEFAVSRNPMRRHPFIWDKKNGFTDLGVPRLGVDGYAVKINNNNQVLVTIPWGVIYGYLWEKESGFTELTPTSEWDAFNPIDLCDSGLVIGEYRGEVYLWDKINGHRKFGFCSNEGCWYKPKSINNFGTTVVGQIVTQRQDKEMLSQLLRADPGNPTVSNSASEMTLPLFIMYPYTGQLY